MKTVTSQTDPLLLPFLLATDEREEETLLACLISEHVEPVVKQIIRYKLQFFFRDRASDVDIEEVFYETRLNLLKRLRSLKNDSTNGSVSNLRSYVTTATRHTCDEYLRRKYPKWRHLKDQIRYQLSTHNEFALWETRERGWLAGLASQNERGELCPSESTPDQTAAVQALVQIAFQDTDVRKLTLTSLLLAIFRACNSPIEIDCLTVIVARLWGIEDHPNESIESDDAAQLTKRQSGVQATPDSLMEYHQLLEQVWSEICQLPRRQRVALLLNLRNPQRVNVITLFPITKIATFEQIAETLEIPLTDFEAVWARLPLDDESIGALLGATRQQVINLRRNARDRLMRRTQLRREQDH